MEDPSVGEQCNVDLSEPTEQLKLKTLMGYQNNFMDEFDTSLTGYLSNVKLLVTTSYYI